MCFPKGRWAEEGSHLQWQLVTTYKDLREYENRGWSICVHLWRTCRAPGVYFILHVEQREDDGHFGTLAPGTYDRYWIAKNL